MNFIKRVLATMGSICVQKYPILSSGVKRMQPKRAWKAPNLTKSYSRVVFEYFFKVAEITHIQRIAPAPTRTKRPTPPSQTLFLPTPKSVKGFKTAGSFGNTCSLSSALARHLPTPALSCNGTCAARWMVRKGCEDRMQGKPL